MTRVFSRWSIFLFFFVIALFESQKIESEGSCSYSATCSASGYTGVCVSISSGCCSSGVVTSNLCSGSSDIKCCTQSECSTPSGFGTCMQSSKCSSQGGTSISGYCVGPSDVKCCVNSVPASGQYGVDIADLLTSSQASCLKNAGISYVIPRGYRSIGEVDTNVCDSMITAAAAGIAIRDTYLFPCPTCATSASEQVGELISFLKTNCKSTWSGRIWLDIEGTSYWFSSYTANQDWYKTLVDSCKIYGVTCGVYASSSQWSALFGNTSFSYGSELPLWYAHYDGKTDLSDFTSFGGWTSPSIKQYAGDVTLCSLDVDRNYATDFY